MSDAKKANEIICCWLGAGSNKDFGELNKKLLKETGMTVSGSIREIAKEFVKKCGSL